LIVQDADNLTEQERIAVAKQVNLLLCLDDKTPTQWAQLKFLCSTMPKTHLCRTGGGKLWSPIPMYKDKKFDRETEFFLERKKITDWPYLFLGTYTGAGDDSDELFERCLNNFEFSARDKLQVVNI
jgi:hypothetical protein